MNLSETMLADFSAQLAGEERSAATVEKYRRDIRAFAAFLAGRTITRALAAAWKERLLEQGYAPATINSMLSAVNRFLRFLGREDCRIRSLRVQRRTFRERGRESSTGRGTHVTVTECVPAAEDTPKSGTAIYSSHEGKWRFPRSNKKERGNIVYLSAK